MRKRQIIEGTVIRRDFPNKGIVSDLIKVSADDAVENEKMEGNCVIKNTLPGQRVRGIVTKSGKNRLEARLLEVLEEAPDAIESPCPHFGICGSCHYLSMTYEQELALKPMAAIFQMILYRNAQGEVLVKFLWNEREMRVRGVTPVSGPYYKWSDIRPRMEGNAT